MLWRPYKSVERVNPITTSHVLFVTGCGFKPRCKLLFAKTLKRARLRVVPHFSSEIVERVKRKCPWRPWKSGANGSIWWGNYLAFLSWFPREEEEVFFLGAGAEKLCSGLNFGRKNGIFFVTGPGPCQIKMTSVDFVLSRQEQWLCILGDLGEVSQLKNFHPAFWPDWLTLGLRGCTLTWQVVDAFSENPACWLLWYYAP